MRPLVHRFFLVVSLLVAGCGEDPPSASRQENESKSEAAKDITEILETKHSPTTTSSTIQGLRFYEAVRGKATQSQELPLVVSLHGQGDKPDTSQLADFGFPVRVVWPEAPTPHETGFQWFPFVTTAQPTPTLARDISGASDKVAAFIREYTKTRPTKGSPVVLGFSQGGMIALDLAVRYPELVESVHPISAGLPEDLWPKRKQDAGPAGKNLPTIRCLHGTEDTIVSIEPTRRMIVRLRQVGYDVTFEEFDGIGHEISTPMGERMALQLVEAVRLSIQGLE